VNPKMYGTLIAILLGLAFAFAGFGRFAEVVPQLEDDAETAVTDMTNPPSRPARERGNVDIAPRVVSKIAARAAGEVDGVEDRTTWDPGGLFAASTSAADADTKVEGTAASVKVTIAVRYPRPAWDVAAEVRRHVARGLGELIGPDHVEVRVDIAELIG
jgi:uncharacterized alkaline shock family protein YloU